MAAIVVFFQNLFCKMFNLNANDAEEEEEDCPICLQPIRCKYTIKCGHDFCYNCIWSWSRFSLRPTCPLCVRDFHMPYRFIWFSERFLGRVLDVVAEIIVYVTIAAILLILCEATALEIMFHLAGLIGTSYMASTLFAGLSVEETERHLKYGILIPALIRLPILASLLYNIDIPFETQLLLLFDVQLLIVLPLIVYYLGW